MNKKEKLLLLTDLSPRLPYGVRVNFKENGYDSHKWKISTLYAPSYNQNGILIDTDHDGWIDYVEYKGCGMSTGSRPLHLGEVLPYLRPMSSMTEEERKEYTSLCNRQDIDTPTWSKIIWHDTYKSIDWLNKKMFAYRTIDGKDMFELGLALKAPKGMYV